MKNKMFLLTCLVSALIAVSATAEEKIEQVKDQDVVVSLIRESTRINELATVAASAKREVVLRKNDVCFSVYGPLNAAVDNITADVMNLSEKFRTENFAVVSLVEKVRAAADYLVAYCVPSAVFEKGFSVKQSVWSAEVTKAVSEIKAANSEFSTNLYQSLN